MFWHSISIYLIWSEAAGCEVCCTLESMSHSFWEQDRDIMEKFLMSETSWPLVIMNWLEKYLFRVCEESKKCFDRMPAQFWQERQKSWLSLVTCVNCRCNYEKQIVSLITVKTLNLRTAAQTILLRNIEIESFQFWENMINGALSGWWQTLESEEEWLGWPIHDWQSTAMLSKYLLYCL